MTFYATARLPRATLHAIRRAERRFGITLGPGTAAQWAHWVKTGRARFVCCRGGGRRLYEVVLGGRRVRFVWHAATLTIVTVIDPEEVSGWRAAMEVRKRGRGLSRRWERWGSEQLWEVAI